MKNLAIKKTFIGTLTMLLFSIFTTAQEQEKYVQYRFTKRFVIKLTRLEGEELDRFMDFCKPSYEVLGLLNDLELGYYIQKKFEEFKNTP